MEQFPEPEVSELSQKALELGARKPNLKEAIEVTLLDDTLSNEEVSERLAKLARQKISPSKIERIYDEKVVELRRKEPPEAIG